MGQSRLNYVGRPPEEIVKEIGKTIDDLCSENEASIEILIGLTEAIREAVKVLGKSDSKG